MQLFDDSIPRDDSPGKPTERLYPFLNRSSWPECVRARALCADWFAHYPRDHRKSMRRRFTSNRDEDHRSAYFELLLHEAVRRLGGNLTVEPSVAGTDKTPDFRVELGGTRFYLEAMVNHATEGDFANSPAFDIVTEYIQDMRIPEYLISLAFSSVPSQLPTKASVEAQMARLIRAQESDNPGRQLYEDGFHSLATGFLELDDAYARIRLTSISEEERPVGHGRNVIRFGGGPMESVVPKWREAIRAKAKAKEIKQYDAPCVIAFNVFDGFVDIANQGLLAVHGTRIQRPTIEDESRDHSASHRQGGLWAGSGAKSWRDNLAAVWMFKFAEPVQDSPSGAQDCLFLGPSSAIQLPEDFSQVTRARTVDGNVEWIEGIALDELLKVPRLPRGERYTPGV